MIGSIVSLIRWPLERMKYLIRSPLWPLGALGLCGLAFALWLFEHDARLRQAYELGQLKKQTATEVSALRAQAEAAIREANEQHAQAIRDLEARQRRLLEDAEKLRKRLAALQTEERAKVEQVATLPASELVTRVAARLGLPPQEFSNPGGSPGAGAVTPPAGAIGPGTNAAPRPQAGEDTQGSRMPDATPFGLSEEALRKVDVALVELDSCREGGTVMSQQVANCNAQVVATTETISQQAAAIEKLNQGLEAKDQILARREAEHQAELKTLRGSRWGGLARTLEHVAIGVAIGVAIP